MGLGFLILVPWMFNCFFTVSGNVEGDSLSAWKSSLSDPDSVLASWDATLVDPCTWFHITCDNDNSVTRIDLVDVNLSGQLVPQLGFLPNLQYLELYKNNISGNIPPELGNLTNLVSLDLYWNKLSGPIPEELGNLFKLRFLRIDNNSLSGTIPMSLTTIFTLQILDLSFNNLSGIVPVNGSFGSFSPKSFQNNPYLKTTTPTSSQTMTNARGNSTLGAISGGIAAALSFTAFIATLVCWRIRVWWRIRKDEDHFFDMSAEEDCEDRGQLTRFSLMELRVATDDFDPKNIVGAGGFGKVYKGCLPDGSLVAVKKLKDVRNKVEEVQFQTELEMISMAVHPNLLHLRGFCTTPTEKLLVYPYMANGSLASCLGAHQGSQPLLDWPKRKQIALGSARGLAYLHHQSDPKVIHRDVKAANILLDEEFEAVVGDFGLAKLMGDKKTHVTTAVRGTIGHIAPEYFSNGKCSEKSDIFGYGVMLLELVSGQKPTDLARIAIEDGFVLLDWVKGHLKDKNLARLVDANLQGNYIEVEAEQLIQVALLCIQRFPMQRPTMLQVLKMLEGDGLAERWQEWQKQEVFFQESNHTLSNNGGWIVDSTSELPPDELSGPR